MSGKLELHIAHWMRLYLVNDNVLINVYQHGNSLKSALTCAYCYLIEGGASLFGDTTLKHPQSDSVCDVCQSSGLRCVTFESDRVAYQ